MILYNKLSYIISTSPECRQMALTRPLAFIIAGQLADTRLYLIISRVAVSGTHHAN
ncbi:hypothetical protein Galf_1724 [Gallionella capsiferriformans ES-2]|uniref:Uncharacterized protein n=1 Tax=Gallionella capsiferriformans (strain ES-2) TaxID=395494 RepID=D9SGT8_GALCS|nr:hypothetical protein Galf_1724 [Gallionella capsiferriformans ES-2]